MADTKNNPPLKKIAMAIGIVILLGSLAYWLFTGPLSRNTGKIRVGFSNETLEALTAIADAKGYFKSEGLDVELVRYQIGLEALEKGLLQNRIDIAPAASVPVIISYLNNNPIRIISIMGRADDQLKILGRRSRGISGIPDLKGKKIATQRGSAAHYFLSLISQRYQLEDNGAKILLTNGPSELIPMMRDRKTDAIIIKEPILSQAKETVGDDGIVFVPSDINYKTFLYVSTAQFLKNNPRTTEKFIRALAKAEGFMKSENESARKIVMEYPGMNPRQVSEQWPSQHVELILDEILVDVLTDQGSWGIANHLVKTEILPPIRPLLDNTFLKKVDPSKSLID